MWRAPTRHRTTRPGPLLRHLAPAAPGACGGTRGPGPRRRRPTVPMGLSAVMHGACEVCGHKLARLRRMEDTEHRRTRRHDRHAHARVVGGIPRVPAGRAARSGRGGAPRHLRTRRQHGSHPRVAPDHRTRTRGLQRRHPATRTLRGGAPRLASHQEAGDPPRGHPDSADGDHSRGRTPHGVRQLHRGPWAASALDRHGRAGEHHDRGDSVRCWTSSRFRAVGRLPRGSVPQLDTVQLDSDHGNQLLDAEAHLVNYRSVLDRMESYALKPKASRDLIYRIAQSI